MILTSGKDAPRPDSTHTEHAVHKVVIYENKPSHLGPFNQFFTLSTYFSNKRCFDNIGFES